MPKVPPKLDYPEIALDEDCVLRKSVMVELAKQIQYNYVIAYLSQYDWREKMNNQMKFFFDNGHPLDYDLLLKVTLDDFGGDENKYNIYKNEVVNYYQLIQEKQVNEKNLNVLRSQLLDLKRHAAWQTTME